MLRIATNRRRTEQLQMRQASEKTGETTDEDGKMATRRLFSGGQSNFQHGTLPARSRCVLLHCNAQQPGNRSCVSVSTHDCQRMRHSKSRDGRPRHQGAVCQRNAGKTASIHRFRRQDQQYLHHNPFMGVWSPRKRGFKPEQIPDYLPEGCVI